MKPRVLATFADLTCDQRLTHLAGRAEFLTIEPKMTRIRLLKLWLRSSAG